jgi:MYXO-CTERM domain-containing protein
MKKTLLSLAVPLLAGTMAVAQSHPATATNPNNPSATQVAHTNEPVDRTADHNNYSWIGLLGLLGLAGLARRREGVRTYDVDRNRDMDRNRVDTIVRDRDVVVRDRNDRDDIRRVG